MEKIKFTYQEQKMLVDFDVARTNIEAVAEFPYSYPEEIISISMNEYKLIIINSDKRYSYENISGVWGNRIIFDI